MRLLVNCPSGESRLLQVQDEMTVLELKQLLLEVEGIPVQQQVLCYAGQHLKDHLPLAEHHLEEYTLSNEVVLYLTRVLAAPKMVFLCSRAKPSQRVPEMVEADMPVGDAMQLLVSSSKKIFKKCKYVRNFDLPDTHTYTHTYTQTCARCHRNMAGPFPPDSPLLAKRQDGSTILLKINPMEGLTQLQERIARHEVSPYIHHGGAHTDPVHCAALGSEYTGCSRQKVQHMIQMLHMNVGKGAWEFPTTKQARAAHLLHPMLLKSWPAYRMCMVHGLALSC
eukprot:569556-Pelagomonas_calceolata.AAC.3